jgi:hypothetical protein
MQDVNIKCDVFMPDDSSKSDGKEYFWRRMSETAASPMYLFDVHISIPAVLGAFLLLSLVLAVWRGR